MGEILSEYRTFTSAKQRSAAAHAECRRIPGGPRSPMPKFYGTKSAVTTIEFRPPTSA
jgi:hypothetical protein